MTPNSHPSLRNWAANDLDRLAVAIWTLARWVAPPVKLVRCEECGYERPFEDDDCMVCKALAEEQRRDMEAYGAGYEDAMREVEVEDWRP